VSLYYFCCTTSPKDCNNKYVQLYKLSCYLELERSARVKIFFDRDVNKEKNAREDEIETFRLLSLRRCWRGRSYSDYHYLEWLKTSAQLEKVTAAHHHLRLIRIIITQRYYYYYYYYYSQQSSLTQSQEHNLLIYKESLALTCFAIFTTTATNKWDRDTPHTPLRSLCSFLWLNILYVYKSFLYKTYRHESKREMCSI